MKRAVIFARVSSLSDRQQTERQVFDLHQYAKENGLQIKKVYEEKISGGKKNIERPILNECLEFCKENQIEVILVSELSRLGRNTFEVLETVKKLIDSKINLYLQKEQLRLLDAKYQLTLCAPILIDALSTCAELERENILFRLNSGKKRFIANGGKVGRKLGNVKSRDQKEKEYAEVIKLLKKGVSIRNVSKYTHVSTKTVSVIKREFKINLRKNSK